MTDSRTTRLQQERQFLLSSLRDLESEHDSGDIDESDYLRLRDDYTARAAAVLSDLDRAEAPESDLRVRRGGRPAGRARGRPRRLRAKDPDRGQPGPRTYVAAILVTVLVGLAIGVLVFSTDQPAEQAAPSSSEASLATAHQLEGEGKAAEALKVYDELLAEEPDNVEALTYRGWLLSRAGLIDQALEALDRAVSLDPRYADAHFFRGIVLFRQRNDPAAAIPEFEAFLANNPPQDSVPAVQNVLDEARRAVASGAPAPVPAPGG